MYDESATSRSSVGRRGRQSGRWARAVSIVGCVLMAAFMLGCSESDDGPEASSSSSGSEGERILVLGISGPLSDPFFSAWKKGADQAAADLGVDYEYLAPKNFDNLGPDLAQLGQAAVSRDPAAITVGNFLPDAQGPSIRAAVDAGIPVWEINGGGLFNWEKDGALGFIGEDSVAVGRAAGELLVDAGAQKGLCVNHVPGNPGTEARCEGLEQAFSGNTEVLNIPGSESGNPTAVQQAIKGALSADKDIDGVYTQGTAIATSALEALTSTGGDGTIPLGTSDLSTNVLKGILSGDILFAIDQQPYLQGYYSVLFPTQYVRHGLRPIGPVFTGPSAITKENAQEVLDAQGSGIRGAA